MKEGCGTNKKWKKLGGQGRWIHENAQITLTLILLFLGYIPRE